MYLVRSLRRSSVIVSSLAPKATAFTVLFLLASSSCTEAPPSDLLGDQDRTTLDETIGPAALDDPTQATSSDADVTLDFVAGPGFCCNPLTIEFRADLLGTDSQGATEYLWDFGDGRSGTGIVAQHTYNFSGEYEIVLEGVLPDGTSLIKKRTLSAGPGGPSLEDDAGAPPGPGGPGSTVVVADAGDDLTVGASALVTLDGGGSIVAPPQSFSFLWTQLDGPAVTLDGRNDAVCTFVAPGNLTSSETVTISLTIAAGDTNDTATVAITILAAEVIGGGNPVGGGSTIVVTANAGPDYAVDAGDVVHLSGAASHTSGPGPLAFYWTQLSGIPVTFNNPALETTSVSTPDIVTTAETMIFRLTVSDGEVSAFDDVSVVVNPDVAADDEAQILAWMTDLPPLQKVHYSWPLGPNLMADPNNPLLFEYVRITHAVTLSGSAPKEHRANDAVRVCKAVNGTGPAIPATLGIMYSPWHEIFPPDYPPTDFGPYHDQEIAQFESYMSLIRQWLDAAYVEQDTVIPVTALIFDSERFLTLDADEPGADAWNAAMDAKYNAFYVIGKTFFPDARIEWFGRGAIQPCRDVTRWCPKRLFTLNEMGETFNCALYIPYNVPLMIDTFRQTYQNATAHGVSEIMVRVSMGAAWDENRKWQMHWDYDTANSWALGAQINDPYYGDHPVDYAPWHAASVVSFFPRPFHSGAPHWGRHFVAYVRGANGIPE